MGNIMIHYNHQFAAYIGIMMSFVSILVISFFVKSTKLKRKNSNTLRHPLDFRPVFKKSKSMSYILSYGAPTFELFAYRSWSFALFFYIGSSKSPAMSIGTITSIISSITITGMIASVAGAKIAERYSRHQIISMIGLSTFVVSI